MYYFICHHTPRQNFEFSELPGLTLILLPYCQIFFPRNDESEYESSDLGRLSSLQASQRKTKQHQQDILDSYQDRNRLMFSSDTSIGSSPNPHALATQSTNLESSFQTESRHGPPPRYQARTVRIIEPDRGGDGIVEVFTPLPSASVAMLRPNRLGPNGDVEFGAVQDLPPAETWVSNWTSQFRSPLGGFISSFHFLVICANALQMSCNDLYADLFILAPCFMLRVPANGYHHRSISLMITVSFRRHATRILLYYDLSRQGFYVNCEEENVEPFSFSSTRPSFMFSFATLPSASWIST